MENTKTDPTSEYDNQSQEEVEQFLSYLGLKEELFQLFLSKGIITIEKMMKLEDYDFSKTSLIDQKKIKSILKNISTLIEAIKFHYSPENSQMTNKPTFLSIIREIFYDLEGIKLTKEILMNSFKLKSMPNNCLPKNLRHENIKEDKIFASFLQNRNIGQLVQIDGFINLKHLYLNKNKLQKIENLNFPNLTILELSDNYIRKIENLENLNMLQSLNLEKNFISILENLDSNINLESLNLSRQYLTKNQRLEISSDILHSENRISCLSLEKCNFDDATKLSFFTNLKKLELANNRIFDLKGLLDSLNSMEKLSYLTIKNNPFIETNKNYRDLIVLNCGSLEEIDGNLITQNEKQFVNSLYIRKMISNNKKNKNVDRPKLNSRLKSSNKKISLDVKEAFSCLKINKI